MLKKSDNKKKTVKPKSGTKPKKRIAVKPPLKNHRFGRTIAATVTDNAIVMATHSRSIFRSRLINVTHVPVPSEISGEDARQAFFNITIAEYLKKYRRPMTKFVMGVGNVDCAFRVISLPNMSSKDMSGAIYWEADKQIPFKLDRSYYGHCLLPSDGVFFGDDKHTSVAVTAVRKQNIDEILKYLQTAGMNVTAIYSELEAVGFLLLGLKDFRKDEVYVLVRSGPSKTEIGFYLGHRLTFVHNIALSAPLPEAETTGGAIIDRYFDTLLTELQNSLDYYAGLHPSATPRAIYMYGDVTCRDNSLTDLSERFGIEFKNISQDLRKKAMSQQSAESDAMMRSLGTIALAMADYKLLNFLPPELKEIQAEQKYYRLAVPGLALLVFCLLGVWMSWKSSITIEQSKLNGLQKQISNFENSTSYTMYQQIKRQITNDQEMLKLLENNPTFLHLNLKELSLITPWKIKLMQYDLSNEKGLLDLTLIGQVVSNDPPPEVVLAEYIAELEKSPFYDLVTLKRHSKKYDKGRFIVDFQIDMRTAI